MRKRTTGHDLVQSTIRLQPIAIWDSETCIPTDWQQLNDACVDFLLDVADIQNRLIQNNYQTLPHRAKDQFGAKWARDNIKSETALIPKEYIEKYWTNVGCKIEAAHVILAWQHRRDLAEWLQSTNWEGTFTQAKEQLGKGGWLDYQLYMNVRRSHEMPAVPVITSPRFPYNQMNAQVGQQEVYQDIIWLHNLAIGTTRYDIIFDASPIWRRYRNIIDVSRPTLFMRESIKFGYEAVFDFTVIEDIERKTASRHHAVGFDRNMDHARVISGSRVNRDGSVSRELGPSVHTLELCHGIATRKVELRRKREKLKRLMPWQERLKAVLEQDIADLEGAIDRLHDEVDASVAADIVGHCRPGDTVGLENLSWSGGGPVKFRHGRTDETITHALGRAGVPLVMVNAAGTTSDCPVCGEKLVVDKKARLVACLGCGFEGDRDSASAPIIGERALLKVLGRKRLSSLDCEPISLSGVRERSERKRAARVAKMERRAARGSRVYRVKENPSPRRPRPVVSGVCVGDDGLVSHVGVCNVGVGDERVVRSYEEGSEAYYVVSVGSGEVRGVFVSREEFLEASGS